MVRACEKSVSWFCKVPTPFSATVLSLYTVEAILCGSQALKSIAASSLMARKILVQPDERFKATS